VPRGTPESASRRASRPAAPRHYVLGGQVSLFSNDALRDVAARNLTRGPWDTSAQVEDMQITGDLRALRYSGNVSVTARAYAGPMLTLRSLWA
jgi:poly-beta-1,6-N-acetyl-D-glucosamine synthase